MKTFALLVVILATAFSSLADPPTLAELNSHLFTNGPIIWQAPTNQLPKSLWTYKMLTPRPFTRAVLSNAVVLASLESKGFPEPSLQNSCFLLDDCQSCQCVMPCYFSIMGAMIAKFIVLPLVFTVTKMIFAAAKTIFNTATLIIVATISMFAMT
jgi:hypothetical protein